MDRVEQVFTLFRIGTLERKLRRTTEEWRFAFLTGRDTDKHVAEIRSLLDNLYVLAASIGGLER